MIKFGPRDKELTDDEQTVEILEIIEGCDGYSNLDNEVVEDYEVYEPEY